MDFSNELKRYVAHVENGLDRHVPSASTRPGRLHAAMRYSLEAGGKRLRPVLLLATADLFQAARSDQTAGATDATGTTTRPDALPAAVAIECVHTYSLIHDDLPCMDNDDLRRGRPTAHKAFDEATALLAGDALLTHAFALLATSYAADASLARALIEELAEASGSRRLIGGQMQDLLAEKQANATPDELDFIHLNKTAAMIEAALVMGGRVGGADATAIRTLREAGRRTGLAFQIIDDVLDATADTETLGKTAGKDARADKTTYVKLHGLDASRRMAREHSETAVRLVRSLPGETGFLAALIESMATRAR
ncbi:MAG TPA: farnesyl diphosphate synthase [Opitutaceae bacterium]|nr:farnesyl diphosphate synthase [Opitutaceae bacterium]